MKKASLLVLTILALTVFVAIPPARCGDGKVERWVLLVGGTPEVIGESGSHQTLRDTYYFYHLLVYDIGISAEHVMYLYVWKVPPPIINYYHHDYQMLFQLSTCFQCVRHANSCVWA